MSCPFCGKPQAGRCEGGYVDYLAGRFPCALRWDAPDLPVLDPVDLPPIDHSPRVFSLSPARPQMEFSVPQDPGNFEPVVPVEEW